MYYVQKHHQARYAIRLGWKSRLQILPKPQQLQENKERNVMSQMSASIGRALYNDSIVGGAQALGRKSGRIIPGYWADLLTLDSESLTFYGCTEDQILDRWIFCGNDSLVREV